MSSSSTVPTLNLILFFLVSTGLVTAIAEGVRWWFTGRKRGKVDSAQIVQGMALDLLQPLHAELAEAQSQAKALRTDLQHLDMELQSVLGWAVIARALLDSHGVEYPTPPPVLRRRG